MILVKHKVIEVAGRLRSRFRSRVLEWEHAIMMFLWGLVLLANPAVFEGPGFVAFKGSAAIWGWAMVIAGMLRLTALCINGYMAQPTAIVRALAAVTGILLFGAISLGFLFSWRWSTALAVYPVVGVFGLFSLYWAVFDVASPDHHNGRSP